jgi:hypothetical protein
MKRWLPVFVFVPAIIAVGLVIYGLTAPTYEQLKAEGNQILARLDKYHSQNGRYPLSASDAQIELPWTRYGRWKYVSSDNGQSCQLSLGEYDGWDPFTLFWQSKDRDWYIDN